LALVKRKEFPAIYKLLARQEVYGVGATPPSYMNSVKSMNISFSGNAAMTTQPAQ
jgi:hypothetical protein